MGPDTLWYPVAIQFAIGTYRRCLSETPSGQSLIHQRERLGQRRFSDMWARNLKAQGFDKGSPPKKLRVLGGAGDRSPLLALYRNVQYHYDSVFRRLHLKWRSTHILRHSYATDFLEKTGRKDALQGQLGHSSSKQTDHYAKITKNSIEAVFSTELCREKLSN